jgi:hypothetical protein
MRSSTAVIVVAFAVAVIVHLYHPLPTEVMVAVALPESGVAVTAVKLNCAEALAGNAAAFVLAQIDVLSPALAKNEYVYAVPLVNEMDAW